ncbi:uncharacterized protein LOC143203812 isoform X3 [Rhynchophorus ferrugineus]
MDALRRTKSAGVMGEKREGVEISELTTYPESGKTTPSFLQVEMVSEPGDDSSAKSSRAGSLVIEEYVEDDDKLMEDDVEVKEFQLESAESSDNISQYLDKEERGPSNSNIKENEPKIDEQERAEPADTEPRKRKLSAESGHSRYSLPKLDVVKKLREAKKKIKVPKLTFPTKKSSRKENGKPTKKETKKEPKSEQTKPRMDTQPEYIYIPLKPPEGAPEESLHASTEPKPENGTDLTKIPEETESVQPKKPSITRRQPLKINPAFKQLLKDVRQLKEKEESEKLKSGTKPVEPEPITAEPIVTDQPKTEEPKQSTDIEQIKDEPPKTPSSEVEIEDNEEKLDLEEQQTSDVEESMPKDDPFDDLFQASTKKVPDPQSSLPSTSRDVRSKSVEPQKKRRSSMESSYSRKSLSRLGILKKLKEASDKIKGAFSLSSLKTPDKKKPAKESDKPKKPKLTSVVKAGQLEKPKVTEPVYIHIPLKPPEGQTDEFSYLEFEPSGPGVPAAAKKEERTDSLDSTSPKSPKNSDIQFIFLTPPSDDEILDEKSETPETPSSEDSVFFGNLKKLAKKVVDEVTPGDALETVKEENGAEKSPSPSPSPSESEQRPFKDQVPEDAVVDQPAAEENTEQAMVVDEEDGLNEASKGEELKSVLKTEGSTLKKKVSFKRKAKTPAKDEQKDSGYEPIEVPKVETEPKETQEKIGVEGERKPMVGDIPSMSMSVDEEKSYLDQKIVKDTSLEEDYNKWSKSGDHEYELINPPDDVTTIVPEVTVIETNNEPKVVISATEILDSPIEEPKKKPFFSLARFQKEKTPAREEQDNVSEEPSLDVEDNKPAEGPSKLQTAFKQKTDQLKNKTSELCTKVRNMKKPHINMPKAPEFKRPQFKKPEFKKPQFKKPEFKKPQFKKPDFKKFKIDAPKINLPKIPDTATIHLPSWSGKKTIQKQTIETRQLSTESNAGDIDTKKRSKFDFDFGSTFPRFRKKKPPQGDDSVFATMPRAKKPSKSTDESVDTVRIPLHSEESEERWDSDIENVPPRTGYEDRETSLDIERLNQQRSDKDMGLEEDYERENQEINRAEFLNRWQHGNFSNAAPGNNEDERIVEQLVEERFKKVGARYNQNREEEPTYIDEDAEGDYNYDERAGREIITDLDNLEDDDLGQSKDEYSSEGSVNLQKKGRLGKLDINSDEFFVVHEIQEGFQVPPNALSQMNEYDPIGSNRSLPQQITEKRTPIKKPKRKKTPHVSQEEIPGDEESVEGLMPPARPRRRSKKTKKRPNRDEIVPYQETISLEDEVNGQRLKFPRESLGILGDDEGDFEDYEDDFRNSSSFRNMDNIKEEPIIPPRKHKSLKSLTVSENDSIMADTRPVNIEDYIIPADEPPRRPNRSRSHTSSLSRVSLPPSQRDVDSLIADEAYLADNQQVPSYLMETPYQKTQEPAKEEVPSYLDEADQPLQPCAEEPCVQDIRDYMGYAIVDKNKPLMEPPLPPPRTLPRRRKRQTEDRFATMPVHSTPSATPTKPLRNYSTIIPTSRTEKENFYENDGDNKENEVDIAQYIEIDDDVNRDLISGEVVQKMRQRPLPAPPRPPRKPRIYRKSLQDITSKENIVPPENRTDTFKHSQMEGSEEPESPRIEKEQETLLHQESAVKEPKLITPSVYSYEETITHGSLVVEPLDGAKLLPDSQLSSKERLIPVTREYSDEEYSEIPESFRALKNPDEVSVHSESQQVQDLEVERLRVNELLANRIVVSDLDASSILTDDLHDRSGTTLRLGEIELSQKLLDEVVRKLEEREREQKKTSPPDVQPPSPPHRTNSLQREPSPEPPQPPPRSCQSEEVGADNIPAEAETQPQVAEEPAAEEPEVDEQPPPRPPEPAEGLYFPSQPPASFYALRAKQYVEGFEGENIPTAPRRKRRHQSRSRPMSRSRSTSDDSEATPSRSLGVRRFSDPSIPDLAGRLFRACGSRANNAIKRLIYHLTENIMRNADGQQDLHVIMIILLVLIAGLILLGYGEDRTVVHLHHWEYFNPPKDI